MKFTAKDHQTMTTNKDMIRFYEAGATFDLVKHTPNGEWKLAVIDESGDIHSFSRNSFEDICDLVDRWIDENISTDDPRRFKGFRVMGWENGTFRAVDIVSAARGALLRWFFEDGRIPTLDELIDLAQHRADSVIVRDGANGPDGPDVGLLRQLRHDNERLRSALRPFADEADAQDARNPHASNDMPTVRKFTIGECRAARAALNAFETEQ